jgi:16S rRNA (guanine966-N2)-methyltransferase
MSILTPWLENAVVLDLFAGSGALGLEALSRGAATAVFVERAPAALDLIRRNIDLLAVGDRARIVKGDAMRFVANLGVKAYDIVLADPPYAEDHAARLVEAFRRSAFATILAVEHSSRTRLDGDDTRTYGDTAITFCHAP